MSADETRQAAVTGAGSGIGRAIALALAAEGMLVYWLIGRVADKLDASPRSKRGRARLIAVDDLATADGISRVAATLGARLDVLVHSAGSYLRGGLTSISGDEWAALDQVNLYAPLLLTAACLSGLRTGPWTGRVRELVQRLVCMPALDGVPIPRTEHALKAAVEDALRQEVNSEGIRVLSASFQDGLILLCSARYWQWSNGLRHMVG